MCVLRQSGRSCTADKALLLITLKSRQPDFLTSPNFAAKARFDYALNRIFFRTT